MKNVLKSILFIVILIALIDILNWFFIPSFNPFSKNNFEIASEKEDTIDVLFLGDSLVYSSISPMEIWNNFGYTSFDCAGAAMVIPDAYDYLEYAVKREHPKVVMMEANVLFRDSKNVPTATYYANKTKELMPIITYHNNWKNYITKGTMDNWINVDKGYKYITKVKSGKDENYMAYTKDKELIPKGNYAYLEKILKLCEENNIEFILIGCPSQLSWKYTKHNAATKIAKKYNIDFINLNIENIGINWISDTKDRGAHLNNSGSKKVSLYLGNYLKDHNLVTDHRNDKKYDEWHTAYKLYEQHSIND